MLHEIKGSSFDACFFHMNVYTQRFAIREFALISGLKYGDNNALEFKFNSNEPNRLLSQYFEGQSKITKDSLFKVF